MAVTPAFVGVTDDPLTTKQIDNSEVTTAVGQVLRQGIVASDPENGAARQKVTNAKVPIASYGAAVRQVPGSFDSGILTLPTILGAVTGLVGSIDLATLFLSNLTDEVQLVTLADGDGALYWENFPMPARDARLFPFGGLTFSNGIKWAVGNAGAVVGHLKGDQ